MELSTWGEFRADESSYQTFTLQNAVSRITILTSWEAAVSSPEHNMIDITMEPSFDVSRVRIIVEDVDTFHKDADKIASYFGMFMAKDFWSPMEAFIVEGRRQEIDFAAQ